MHISCITIKVLPNQTRESTKTNMNFEYIMLKIISKEEFLKKSEL